MLKKRDAQGLPINIIIIAILGLIVLIVLIFIFTSESGNFFNFIKGCEGKGGECRTEDEGCTSSEMKINDAKCPEEEPVCCKKIFDENE